MQKLLTIAYWSKKSLYLYWSNFHWTTLLFHGEYSRCLSERPSRGHKYSSHHWICNALGHGLFSECSNLKRFTTAGNYSPKQSKWSIGIDLNLTSEHVQIWIDFVSNLALCVRVSPRPVLPVFISRVALRQSPLSVPSFIISQSIKDVSTCSSDIGRKYCLRECECERYMSVFCSLSHLCSFFFQRSVMKR